MDYSAASVEELEQLVQQKNCGAIIELAERYLKGTGGVAQNYTRAYQIYHKGEKCGYPEAYQGIGAMYLYGLGLAKNKLLATKYYGKAGVPMPKATQPPIAAAPVPAGEVDVAAMLSGEPTTKDLVSSASDMISDPLGPVVSTLDDNLAPSIAVEEDEVAVEAVSAPIPNDIKAVKTALSEAELDRQAGNRELAKQKLGEVLRALKSGQMNESAKVIAILEADAHWQVGFIAYQEKDYKTMEVEFALPDVLDNHPKAAFLRAISHYVGDAPDAILHQDMRQMQEYVLSPKLGFEDQANMYELIAEFYLMGYNTDGIEGVKGAYDNFREAADLGSEAAKEELKKFTIQADGTIQYHD